MKHWKDIRARQTIPPGYLAVPEVFEIIGQHHFGPSGKWSGAETNFEELGREPARPAFVFEGDTDIIKDAALYNRDLPLVLPLLGKAEALHLTITNKEWISASDRWRKWERDAPTVRERRSDVFWIMHRLGMSPSQDRGLGYCFIDSMGKVRELDVSEWNCGFEVACDRFEQGALCSHPMYKMHRPDPWDGGRDYLSRFTMPIFVAQANLEQVLDSIPVFDTEIGRDDPSRHVVERFQARRAKAKLATPHEPYIPTATVTTSPRPTSVKNLGGPKPRAWVRPLHALFEKHHDDIVELSQRDLLRYVHARWPATMKEKPGSANAVDKHRTIYLENRARTAR